MVTILSLYYFIFIFLKRNETYIRIFYFINSLELYENEVSFKIIIFGLENLNTELSSQPHEHQHHHLQQVSIYSRMIL